MSLPTTSGYGNIFVDEREKKESSKFRWLVNNRQLFSELEKWDAIIFIKPTGTYVNDGYRDMTMADDTIRNEFSDYLDHLIITNHPNVPVYYIDGDYIGNYAKAIEIIDTIYKDI